ncbi:hypothetical protein LLG95_14570 [bacterium]|nr:hypothetical protein [bacterium]
MLANKMPCFWRAAVIPLALLCCQACTVSVWKYGLRKEYHLKGIEGISPNDLGKPDFSGYLLVSYGNGTGSSNLFYEKYFCAIPIIDGRVQDPFDYKGSQTGLKCIANDVSPERLNRIRKYSFDAESINLASKLYYEKKYIPNDRYHNPQFGSGYSVSDGVSLIPYHPNTMEFADPEKNSRVHWRPGKNPLEPPFDVTCRVIILPSTQPVSKPERVRNVFGAVIETPFTIVADLSTFLLFCIFDPKNALSYWGDEAGF